MSTLNIGIELDQGADFAIMLAISGDNGPVDITGYKFLSEMKTSTDPSAAVAAEFVFTIQNQTTNKGQVLMSLPASATTALELSVSDNLQKGRLDTPYVFDVKMQDTSVKVTRIIQGIVYVSPAVTIEAFT